MIYRKNIKNSIKNRYKNLPSVTSANISTENLGIVNVVSLKINGIMKMITIRYVGNIRKIIAVKKNLTIRHNKARRLIVINNFKKKNLQNDILFKFLGRIQEFGRVELYNWGASKLIVDKEKLSETINLIKNNKNVIDSSDETFHPLDYGEFE